MDFSVNFSVHLYQLHASQTFHNQVLPSSNTFDALQEIIQPILIFA